VIQEDYGMAEKAQILIVEDEKQIARFLQMELEHEGYECGIETNGAAALDRIISI
jgi:two-component system response regulator ArlR